MMQLGLDRHLELRGRKDQQVLKVIQALKVTKEDRVLRGQQEV
jgi:hypothetical protein